MLRRHWMLAACAVLSMGLVACTPPIPSHISVDKAQLESALQGQFPKQFPVAGLLQLQMQAPQLQTVPETNQLQAVLPIQLAGNALKNTYPGSMQLRFGLRYEPTDRTVRTERVQVQQLRLDEAPAVVADMLDAYGSRLAAMALEDFVLYHVPAKTLSEFEERGYQPGAMTVTASGLDVAIVPRVVPGTAQP